MGQEQSHTMVDEDTPPRTLSSRNIDGVAQFIKEGKATKIVVLTGAGISTSAGIPDFRSPETGLYANLARLNLPYAEAVFSIDYFRTNPLPFYTLAHELYPGKFRPTISHAFIKLLHDKGLLLKLFTQNIDCLERQAGVPGEMIVEAHGSFASQSCIDCHLPFPSDLMRDAIESKKPAHCPTCNGLVKPDIVFFGEALPSSFFENRYVTSAADLCIVMGTSLSVMPFAALPQYCREGVPRVLVNKDQAGDLGSRRDDVLMLGDCDEEVKKLAKALGWLEDLEAEWAKTAPEGEEVEKKVSVSKKDRNEELKDEVDELTREVEKTLSLNERYVASHLEKEPETAEQDTQHEIARQLEEPTWIPTSRDTDTIPPLSPAPTEVLESKPELSSLIISPTEVVEPKSKPVSETKTDIDGGGGGLRHVFFNLQED